MNYTNWDYTLSSYFPEHIRDNIEELFKTQSSETIKNFYYWLADNHKEFAFMYRDNLISSLLKHRHFDLTEQLFTDKIYQFDEKIAVKCAFYLGLDFDDTFFDYWREKVQTLDRHSQSSAYKKFWHEFFSYQFLKSEEIMNNLPNLVYVFDKVPFYIQSEYDIVNGYLIKSRENFFTNRLRNLQKDLQPVILQQVAILCGIHYSEFKSTFLEEFQNFPEIFETFTKAQFYQTLNNKFEHKPSGKKTKI